MEDIAAIPNFKLNTGLGLFPNSGPPVGGFNNTPGTGYYGQPLTTLLPGEFINFGFGKRSKRSKRARSAPKRSKRSKRTKRSRSARSFGYPVSNQSFYQGFRRSGPGNTPGGVGGPILQGVPNFQQYWG